MRNFCTLLATFFFISCGTNKQSDKSLKPELVSEDIDVLTTLLMANEYYQRDDYEQAAKGFELVIHLDSTIGEAHYKLGYSLAQLESDTMYIPTHPSIGRYLTAAELNYRPAEAYFNAAIFTSIFELNDSAAIELFNKSLKLNPEQPEVYELIEAAEQRLAEDLGTQRI